MSDDLIARLRAWHGHDIDDPTRRLIHESVSALEQAEKALNACLDGHRDHLSMVDSGDCYCSRCELAREALAALAGRDGKEQT